MDVISRKRLSRLFAIFVLVSAVIPFSSGGPAPALLHVPEGNGNPILIDGIFSPGEWKDAARISVNNAVTLFVKQFRGHVFLGVLCPSFRLKWSDLFLCPDGKTVDQLHVSAQLGEGKLDAEGKEPDFRWGETKDWYANEGRWDERRLQALVQSGKSRNEAQAEVLYPCDGFEYQIKLDKFKSRRWQIRLSVGNFIDGQAKESVFPPQTERNNTAGWLELVFSE